MFKSIIKLWLIFRNETIYKGRKCKFFYLVKNKLHGSNIIGSLPFQIRIHPLLPFGIMGLMCLKSAFLAFLLPETQGQDTPETIGDINTIQSVKTRENDKHTDIYNALRSETKF